MSEQVHGPAYRIQTSRLVIRCWNPVDAPLLKQAIDESLEHLRPWIRWAEKEPEELDKKIERLRQFRGNFDLDQEYVYGVFDREQTRVLGGTALHTRVGPGALEIGYWIHQKHIHQGLATELSAALTKVAFEIHGVYRVEIHCDPRNVRSAAVPRKLGFTHEGTLRQHLQIAEGKFRDSMMWTLLKNEYPASPAASASIEAFDAVGRRIL